MEFLRIKRAAEFLGISTVTLRKYCNEGKVPFQWSVTGQRIFNLNELTAYKNQKLGVVEKAAVTIHYARSSSGSDASIESQLLKLAAIKGEPDYIFKDKGSGLNDKRKGLAALMKKVEENHTQGLKTTILVTQDDRLTRFGNEYLTQFFRVLGAECVSINDEGTKEPEAVLMQDFMSLIASFSGKFYRLRGWKEQQRLIDRAKAEVDRKQDV